MISDMQMYFKVIKRNWNICQKLEGEKNVYMRTFCKLDEPGWRWQYCCLLSIVCPQKNVCTHLLSSHRTETNSLETLFSTITAEVFSWQNNSILAKRYMWNMSLGKSVLICTWGCTWNQFYLIMWSFELKILLRNGQHQFLCIKLDWKQTFPRLPLTPMLWWI